MERDEDEVINSGPSNTVLHHGIHAVDGRIVALAENQEVVNGVIVDKVNSLEHLTLQLHRSLGQTNSGVHQRLDMVEAGLESVLREIRDLLVQQQQSANAAANSATPFRSPRGMPQNQIKISESVSLSSEYTALRHLDAAGLAEVGWIDINGDGADKLLAAQPAGTFLVRYSRNACEGKGSFVLSCKSNDGRVEHTDGLHQFADYVGVTVIAGDDAARSKELQFPTMLSFIRAMKSKGAITRAWNEPQLRLNEPLYVNPNLTDPHYMHPAQLDGRRSLSASDPQQGDAPGRSPSPTSFLRAETAPTLTGGRSAAAEPPYSKPSSLAVPVEPRYNRVVNGSLV